MNPDEIGNKISALESEQARQGVKIDNIACELREVKENGKEISKLVESVHDLALSVKEIAIKQENYSEKTDRNGNAIEELKSKPSKRWDIIISVIITLVLTMTFNYFVK